MSESNIQVMAEVYAKEWEQSFQQERLRHEGTQAELAVERARADKAETDLAERVSSIVFDEAEEAMVECHARLSAAVKQRGTLAEATEDLLAACQRHQVGMKVMRRTRTALDAIKEDEHDH